MTTVAAPPLLGEALPPDGLADVLFTTSPAGIMLLRPMYAADDATIVDLAWVRLNAAAQRMLNLPEQPTDSFLTLFPASPEVGVYQFYRDAFLSGRIERRQNLYQEDQLDGYYDLVAQRSGDVLVVHFTDGNDQPRTAVEEALRASQAREKAARAEAEAQRQRFYDLLMQLPAQVAVHEGPDQVFTLVNPGYRRLFPTRAFEGLPVREALPELAGPGGILDVLDGVYHTGEPFHGTEVELWVDFTATGRPEQVYLNAVFLPLRDAQGRIDGVLDFSVDVTEQVHARRQEQQLNQKLENHVQQRTREAEVARAEAEEQRNRLVRLFSQAPAQINLFQGPNHVWTLVHPRTQALLPGRQLHGLPRRQALPELPEEQHAHFDRIYRTGQPEHVVESSRRLDRFNTGELHEEFYDVTFQPKFDAAGQVEGVMSFAVDVTERVRARRQADALQAEMLTAAQRQAQEREALFRILADTPAAIALLRGPEHRFEYVNTAYQQLFPERQLTGKAVAEALPETREAGFLTELDRVYHTGETFFGLELPMRVQPEDGRPIQQVYYTFTYQAYRENDQIAGISIFAFDVTDQVQARQQRALQEQQLQELFEQAPVAIALFRGAEYIVEVANPLVAQLWGRTPAEVLGRPLFEALPEVRGQGFKELLDGVRSSGEAFVAEGIGAQLRRGETYETVYLNFVYQPLRDAKGTVTGVGAVATDVTAQVQDRKRVQQLNEQLHAANQELSNSNQQLTRTNVDLDNFIYTASHDLKAPISNIEGLLYLLQEELPAAVTQDPEIGPTLARMLEAVERFKRTIDHLTEVSKLQKEHTPANTLVNLAAVVEDVRQDLQPTLQAAGAKLTIDVPALPPIPFTEKNLRSVVYNLLSNAVKYRHPDRTPHVDVRAHVREGHTVLEVHDNGLGLDEKHLPRLFTMFQRFHDHVEGTGIGLYMINRMVENAGGRIEVHSQLGSGTTFFVFLPHATTSTSLPS